jgi:hypothetical protein
MRVIGALLLSCSLLLGSAIVAAAQQTSPPGSPPPSDSPEYAPLSPDQVRELAKWQSDMERWRRYDAKWQNQPVHDVRGRIVARKPPPEAPVWLEAYCASAEAAGVLEVEERTKTACRYLVEPRATPEPPSAAAQVAETRKHSSFMTRVHLDGLWTTTSTDARLYGLVGSHVSLVDIGRVQIFGPPGVMLLSVPNGNGGRRVAVGYTWGVSLRLMDLRLASHTKNATLFLNVSKVWVNGGMEGTGKSPGLDIVGFSVARKKAN